MAITKSLEPTHTDPIPISACAFYRLLADAGDVIGTNGSFPYVQIQWPGSPTAPSNGTAFVIQGHNFTFNTGSNFTATSFKVVNGNRAATQANFDSMINANYFFKNVAVTYSGTGNDTTTLIWQTCVEEPNFSSAQMDLSAFDAMGCTTSFSNGSSPVYVDGYSIVVNLMRKDNSGGYNPITEPEPVPFTRGCNTLAGMGKADFDMMPDIRKNVYTAIPDLTDSSFDIQDGSSLFQICALNYGWVERDANCQPVSGTFKRDTDVMVWGGVIELEEAYGVRPYYPGATGGLPPGQSVVKFLTTQPDRLSVFEDSKFWLWFFINKGVQTFTSLKVHVTWLNIDGVSGGFSDVAISGSLNTVDILCINASPGFVDANTSAVLSNMAKYTLAVWTDGNVAITETRTYYIDRDCNAGTDLLFTTSLGGISPIPVEVVEWEIEQTGNEICIDVPCVATRSERSKWLGRGLANIRNVKAITYRVKQNWSNEMQQYFADFKRASQRWVRVQGTDGGYIPRKLFVETGAVQIFKDGETIELLVKGSYNYTQPQGIAEPSIFDF